MTLLERGLYVWTIVNAVIGGCVLFFEPIVPIGSLVSASVAVIGIICAALCSVWVLRRATVVRLLFGGVYWLLQWGAIRIGDNLYRFAVGLCVNFKIVEHPSFFLSLNLLGIATSGLYFLAAYERYNAQVWADLKQYEDVG